MGAEAISDTIFVNFLCRIRGESINGRGQSMRAGDKALLDLTADTGTFSQ